MPKEEALIKLFYLAAAVLFILGLKGLSHPRTAVRGNLLAALGMLLAIVVTLTDKRIVDFRIIIAGFVAGGFIGTLMAYRAPMMAMPQVVAIFNGFGGGASALAVGAALEEALRGEWIEEITVQFTSSATLAALIGAVSLTGSMVAFGKLQGFVRERPVLVPGRHAINLALVTICLGLSAWQVAGYHSLLFSTGSDMAADLDRGILRNEVREDFAGNGIHLSDDVTVSAASDQRNWTITDHSDREMYIVREEGGQLNVYARSALPFWMMCAVASLLGIMLVIPIGGADMPVVISLLNAYSGIAAAGHGWVLNNSVLIIAGSLVGAAGFILTALMSKAMNRSLANIMFAGVGSVVATEAESEDIYAGRVKSASPEEVAMLLDGARRVVVAPGYGLAVSQAQYAIQDLMKLLEARGAQVEFAIHPVAGRMPGHMNVLLAEANIPYDKLKEMDLINPTFRQTDVVLVVGANDVVNPMARDADPSIPIAGMPILNVDQARSVVVIKRSLAPGFAGIPNPLFAADNTLMLFGDAKQMVMDLVVALKQA
ncbi:MAG: NAD(P)(+) transhydrogenase (Re/Si-specific) subunit beta [Bacteroidota bacterium]